MKTEDPKINLDIDSIEEINRKAIILENRVMAPRSARQKRAQAERQKWVAAFFAANSKKEDDEVKAQAEAEFLYYTRD